MPIALMYHDVVCEGDFDASGFPGGASARYKLTHREFVEQMEAHARVNPGGFSTPAEPSDGAHLTSQRLITFDDGGSSAMAIAAHLEQRGWHGYFFLVTDLIGRPGFVSADQARELRRRGHVVGSQSRTHPPRMSSLSPDEMLAEWRDSRTTLSDILAEDVTVASVPGGFYSRRVAQSAAAAGYGVLFNSEPTTRCKVIDGCLVVGRYTVYRGMTTSAVAALTSGKSRALWKQSIAWNLRKAAKAFAGGAYARLRHRILERGRHSPPCHAEVGRP